MPHSPGEGRHGRDVAVLPDAVRATIVREKIKKETKRPTQESLGSGEGKTFMEIVVFEEMPSTLFSGFFGTKLQKNVNQLANGFDVPHNVVNDSCTSLR